MRRVILIFYVMFMAYYAHAQETVNFNRLMLDYGLVDIRELDNTIFVDLKYSTDDNFVGVDMYGALDDAYLEREFAQRIVRAQKILMQRNPNYRLLIYDAARPISVQRTMRKCVEGTPLESFVADGTKGGRHNYGVAVDLTIATADGIPLDMGTPFDDLTDASSVKGTPDTDEASTRTPEVYRLYCKELVAGGVISHEAAENRMLLIEVMYEVGLVPYRREWWHFEELMSMSETRSTYKLLDF